MADAEKKQGLEARKAAGTILTRVVDDHRNLDALCDHEHGIKEFLALPQRDQALVRAICITALRKRTQIEAILNKLFDRPPPKKARHLIHAIHIAAAQILYLDVPERAAIDLAVTLIKSDKRSERFSGLANAILRRMSREKDALLTKFESVNPLPNWMAKQIKKDYGKSRAERIFENLSTPTGLDVSVKSDSQKWAKDLGGTVLKNGSIRLANNAPVQELPGYYDGEWWVQDAAASFPASLLDCDPGAKILELCAAPGGKTAQLLNRGFEVTALDISKPRLKRLESNLERLKFTAEIVQADILEWESDQQYDAILLDAPCSSTGTLRRHPDVMWTRSKQEISELADLQFKLVLKAKEFLKPGGTLLFANCSIFKEEGEDLLARIQSEVPDLEHRKFVSEDLWGQADLMNGQGALRSLPYHSLSDDEENNRGLDGFFAAKFIKV